MHGIVVGKMGYDITKKWKIIECLCVGLLVLVGNVVAESDCGFYQQRRKI